MTMCLAAVPLVLIRSTTMIIRFLMAFWLGACAA